MASKHYDYDSAHLSEFELREDGLFFQCPCGDEFLLTLDDFKAGKRVAQCPTCSLTCAIECTEEEAAAFIAEHCK